MGQPASGDLVVDHGVLDNASANIANGAARIQNRLDLLERDLDHLKAGWDGEAKEAYVIAKTKWDNAIEDLRQLLAQTGRGVDDANQSYTAADHRNAGLF